MREMKNSSIFTIVLLSIGFLLQAYAEAQGKKYAKYEVFLYKNEDAGSFTTLFVPSDKIFIRINFFDLKAGDYTLNTYWYNPSGDLQDTGSYRFTLQKNSPYSAWAWLTLHKKGRLTRVFSINEYNAKFYGKWQVKAFLNDREIAAKYFEVR